MKIFIYGESALVSSVYVSEIEGGLDLIINARERWIPFQRRGSSSEHMAISHRNTGAIPVHDSIEVMTVNDDGSPDKICEVVLEPETPEEIQLLRGMAYASQEKEQILMLYVKPEQKMRVRPLAQYTAPAAAPAASRPKH
jgi:hypothetical protein